MQQQAALVFPDPAFVDLSGFRMAYREWGLRGSAGSVLLIHGITGSSLSWNEVGPAFGARHRVVAVDLKGHGDSDRPPRGYRLADQVRELASFCALLGLHRPVVVGHSWGGAIALQLATSTDLVGRLVLEDPAMGGPDPDPQGWPEFVESLTGWMGLSREEAERRASGFLAEGWSEAGVAAKVDAAMKGSPDAMRSTFAENFPWNLRGLLSELTCPTLLLYAAPELGGIVDAEALGLARANPSVETVLVAGADHNIHRGRLGDFMAAVEPFLADQGS